MSEQSAADIREKVAQAIYHAHRPYKSLNQDEHASIYRQSADAAIATHLAALEAAGWAVVAVDDLRQVLRNGVDWTDDHGPAVRLADAVNAAVTHRSAREADNA